jgi:hypothetical protein
MRSVVNERNRDRYLPLPLLRFKDHGCGHAALETVRRSDPTPVVGISVHYSWKWRKTVSFPLFVEFWGRLGKQGKTSLTQVFARNGAHAPFIRGLKSSFFGECPARPFWRKNAKALFRPTSLQVGPIQGKYPAGNPAIDERYSYNSKREE